MPPVAGSRPPTIWISVLLPQPLGPQDAGEAPGAESVGNDRARPRRAAPAANLRHLFGHYVHAVPPPGFFMHDLSQPRVGEATQYIRNNAIQDAALERDGSWSHPPGGAEAAAQAGLIEHGPADPLRLGDHPGDIGKRANFPSW